MFVIENTGQLNFHFTYGVEKPESKIDQLHLKAHDIMKLYNANRGTLPMAKIMSNQRLARLKVELKKGYWQDIDKWKKAILGFATSEFCIHKWQPNFDDLIDEAKRLRAYEGGYKATFKQVV